MLAYKQTHMKTYFTGRELTEKFAPDCHALLSALSLPSSLSSACQSTPCAQVACKFRAQQDQPSPQSSSSRGCACKTCAFRQLQKSVLRILLHASTGSSRTYSEVHTLANYRRKHSQTCAPTCSDLKGEFKNCEVNTAFIDSANTTISRPRDSSSSLCCALEWAGVQHEVPSSSHQPFSVHENLLACEENSLSVIRSVVR